VFDLLAYLRPVPAWGLVLAPTLSKFRQQVKVRALIPFDALLIDFDEAEESIELFGVLEFVPVAFLR
jgi:hypothetical protein